MAVIIHPGPVGCCHGKGKSSGWIRGVVSRWFGGYLWRQLPKADISGRSGELCSTRSSFLLPAKDAHRGLPSCTRPTCASPQKMRWIWGKTVWGREVDVQSVRREGGWAVLCGQEMVKEDIPMEILGEEASFLTNFMKEQLWSQEENQENKETRKHEETRFQGEEHVQPYQEGDLIHPEAKRWCTTSEGGGFLG